MHVMTPSRRSPGPLPSVVVAASAGTVLVVVGVWLAFLSFATPLLGAIVGQRREAWLLAQLFTWALAVAAPGACLLLGADRLAAGLVTLRHRRPARASLVRRAVGGADDLVVGTAVDLGDGRPIPEIVIGRFGAAVIRELPASDRTRRTGAAWEVHAREGWTPIENPLDRAARDAERVRRWFAAGDEDFVTKVYAAVVTDDATLPRTPTCAVVPEAQLGRWLASLPAQRSLTPARRARIVARIRAAG